MKNKILLFVGLTVVFVVGYFYFRPNSKDYLNTTGKISRSVIGRDGFSFDGDTPGYDVYLDLIQGCPTKDCIPSIDEPTFESTESASEWMFDEDLIFVLNHDGEVRGYPQKILNRHEIVNDVVDGDPILITFCPLCGSALAFERFADGEESEFGVSGKLHNTDLVMYDRKTESLWQQITGEAIVGERIGDKLNQLPFFGLTWSDFVDRYKEAEVLSRPTGLINYDRYPYGDYEESGETIFPVDGGIDSTIHPKTVIYGVEISGEYKAYPEDKIVGQKFTDDVGGVEIEVDFATSKLVVVRKDDNSELPATRMFWFAWKAFRPDTEVY